MGDIEGVLRGEERVALVPPQARVRRSWGGGIHIMCTIGEGSVACTTGSICAPKTGYNSGVYRVSTVKVVCSSEVHCQYFRVILDSGVYCLHY